MKTTAIQVNIEEISDRQNLLKGMEARRQGLDAYMMDRLDTHWIYVKLHGQETTFSVDPVVGGVFGEFTITRQHGPRGNQARILAESAWATSDERTEAMRWVKNLSDGGYFDDGRFPGYKTYRCDRCGGQWKNGSSHEHVRYDGRVVVHSGRQYAKIMAAGLEVSWRPGHPVEEPSLEEAGE